MSVPKALACKASRTMPRSLANKVTRATVLMTWMVLFSFIQFPNFQIHRFLIMA